MQAFSDIQQVIFRVLRGKDLLPGPENIQTGVQVTAKLFQIVSGHFAEMRAQYRIIGIIGRTKNKMPGITLARHLIHDAQLLAGKGGNGALHVIK